MKLRLKGNKLLDYEGNEIGHVVDLVIELDDIVKPAPVEQLEIADAACGDDILGVWSHYVAVMGPRRKELDPATRAVIREALKVASAEECCRAIDGCRASAFHMGQNDRSKKYNRVSQILKGKRGIRTTREQIDLFLDIAEKTPGGSVDASVDTARLSQAKRNLLDAWEFPRSAQARKQAEMSAAWLAQHGFVVTYDSETGRPIVAKAA